MLDNVFMGFFIHVVYRIVFMHIGYMIVFMLNLFISKAKFFH